MSELIVRICANVIMANTPCPQLLLSSLLGRLIIVLVVLLIIIILSYVFGIELPDIIKSISLPDSSDFVSNVLLVAIKNNTSAYI